MTGSDEVLLGGLVASIVQQSFTHGYGGLEMVVSEFHEWLLKKNRDAYIITLKDSPLHIELLAKGYKDSVFGVADDFTKFGKASKIRKLFDTPDSAFLFHQHPKLMNFCKLSKQAKVSMLSHTFYKSPKRGLIRRYIFSKVDQWIALTKLHRDNLIETTGIAPSKVCIIPNGVNLNKFLLDDCDKKNSGVIHIGVVARLDPQKGQDIAIHAIRKLKDNGFSVELHLFGEDTAGERLFAPFLRDLVREFHLEREVKFEGFKANIEKEIANLDLLWMPSHKETFGRCIVEAMVSGVPVIASNAGGVPDIIRHSQNGMLFETKDPYDLFLKTSDLIKNFELREKISTAALVEAREKYDQDKIWSELLKMISPLA